MAKPIIIALLLALATADARACDRFKYWRYGFPQKCNQREIYLARHVRPPMRFAARIVPPAPSEEAQALARLRDAMIRSTWP